MTQVRAVGIPQEGWPCGSILSERPVGICSQRLGMLVLVFNSGQRKEVPPIAAALTQAILDPAGQTDGVGGSRALVGQLQPAQLTALVKLVTKNAVAGGAKGSSQAPGANKGLTCGAESALGSPFGCSDTCIVVLLGLGVLSMVRVV